ncbi:MAG TPA: hypothetical protein VE173_02165, partial [Longimicrobiales bacterium]|nr:hypothetical protein [Longimicrobiales bacterium]
MRAPEAPPPSRAHRRAGGGFRNPWAPHPADETATRSGGFLRWRLERLRGDLAPDPPGGAIPTSRPQVVDPRLPAKRSEGELHTTWVGHATFLLQLPGLNLLTDPIWSRRASPTQRLGPAR